jgi:hypothetical protein
MFASDAEPQQSGRQVGLAGNGGSALDGRLDAPEARGVADDSHRPADGVGAFGPTLHVEGHDGAEAGHEASRRRVGRMVGAAGERTTAAPGWRARRSASSAADALARCSRNASVRMPRAAR